MSAGLSPLVSEFESEEQAARYDAWLRAKVQSSVDDLRPNVAHDEVMAQLKARRATKGRVLNTREIIVHPNYLVIYRLTDRIEILSVLHARQQYP
jgi:plasmid stabilization system protein ParE